MVDLPLISVIIPVYNARNTVENTVSSVINQPNADKIELLLIDDGSTDGSANVLDQLAKSYSNVKVFHQENKGVSSARNMAIELARGKYLAFLDSDDWWEYNFLTDDLVNELQRSQSSDLYVFSYQKVSPNKKWKKILRVENDLHIYNMPDFSHIVNQHPCAFLYRLEYLNTYGFRYLPLTVAEDIPFTQLCCTFAKSMSSIDRVIFSYYMNYNSVLHTKKSVEKFMEIYKSIYIVNEIYESNGLQCDTERSIISLITESLHGISAENSYRFVKKLIAEPEFALLSHSEVQPWGYLQKDAKLWRNKPYLAYVKCKIYGIPKLIKHGLVICPLTRPLAEFIQFGVMKQF